MIGLIATCGFLSVSGIKYFETKNVMHSDWNMSIFIIPFIISSFGWHNMIPSITAYLGNDGKKSLKVILISASCLLILYCVWVIGLQGIIPLKGDVSLTNSFLRGEIVTEPLSRLIQNDSVRFLAIYMAFFAIITSLLAQGLSVVDFLADAFRIKNSMGTRVFLCSVLLVPTLICSQCIPGVFLRL